MCVHIPCPFQQSRATRKILALFYLFFFFSLDTRTLNEEKTETFLSRVITRLIFFCKKSIEFREIIFTIFLPNGFENLMENNRRSSDVKGAIGEYSAYLDRQTRYLPVVIFVICFRFFFFFFSRHGSCFYRPRGCSSDCRSGKGTLFLSNRGHSRVGNRLTAEQLHVTPRERGRKPKGRRIRKCFPSALMYTKDEEYQEGVRSRGRFACNEKQDKTVCSGSGKRVD